MDLFDTTQLGLSAALRGSAARQTAIAQNLANVNTPGYRRMDVSFADALHGAMAKGDDAGLEAWTPATTVDDAAPMRADGNSVDLDTEAAAQASNGLQYQALTTVMGARIDILKSAMGL